MNLTSVLYFPSIEFRSVEWVKLALLLWDRVYRIVPPGYTPQDSNEVLVAQEHGLVINIHPSQEEIQQVGKEYERFIHNLAILPAGLTETQSLEPHEGLHLSKVDQRLYPLLEQLSQGTTASGFMDLPRGVVRGYMLYLAKAISGRRKLATASDLRDAWTIAPYFRDHGNFHDDESRLGSPAPEGYLSAMILRDLLPSSLVPISMCELSEFVLRRGSERERLRAKINDLAADIALCNTQEEVASLSTRFASELEAAKKDFRDSSGFLKDFDTHALLTVGIPTAATLYGTAASWNIGEMLKVSASVLIGSVAAYKMMKDRAVQRKKESAWSYLIDLDAELLQRRAIPRYDSILHEFIND